MNRDFRDRLNAYGAMRNADENNKQLTLARELLSDEQFHSLYRSYRSLFWAQIAPLLILVVAVGLTFLLVPLEGDPARGIPKSYVIAAFETTGFLLAFPVWLIVTQFAVGRLWHRYARWYRKGKNLGELKELFR